MKTLEPRDADDVAACAARWAARIDAEAMTGADEAALAGWMAADPRHAGALLRAQAVMATFDRLCVLGHGDGAAHPRLDTLSSDTLSPLPLPGSPSKRWLLADKRRLVVSFAAIAVVGSAALWLGRSDAAQAYETGRGEIRSLVLAGRAAVAIDTISAVTLDATGRMPSITVERGQAMIDVAPDSARPVVVNVGDSSITTAGAVLSVRRAESGADAGATTILIRQGHARVLPGGNAAPIMLTGGERLRLRAGTPPRGDRVSSAALRRAFAWREGMIDLDAMPLDQAAREFARYNEYRILVDPAVAGRRVTGLFSVGRPREFARAAALSLDLTADLGRDGAHIRR